MGCGSSKDTKSNKKDHRRSSNKKDHRHSIERDVSDSSIDLVNKHHTNKHHHPSSSSIIIIIIINYDNIYYNRE